jgi:hypothetical protein
MDALEAVLLAAHAGIVAETPEEGFAQIRNLTGTDFSDAELADAVAVGVCDGQLCEPVRLLPQRLQCFWQLEVVRAQ